MSSFLDELYRTVILEHSRNPHNYGTVEDANREASGNNPLCGDDIQISLHVTPEGKIEKIGFTGHGCAISQSSASLMTDAVQGLTSDEALELLDQFVEMATGPMASEPDKKLGELRVMAGVRRFPARVKCATLAWHTLEAALKQKEVSPSEKHCG
jgi:nitrogen fixation NifU-like protein